MHAPDMHAAADINFCRMGVASAIKERATNCRFSNSTCFAAMGNLCSFLKRSNAVTQTKQYNIFQSQFDRLVTCVGLNVDEVAGKAFAKKLFNPSILEEATNPLIGTKKRATKLLLAIRGKIEERSDHFDTFTEILREIPTCKDMADELDRLLSGAAQQETQQGR